jgi:glycosyltransferase involved in cell wall biosynthesis
MKKTKILYVITKGGWGGAQRYVLDLVTSLPKEKFEVAVACGDSRIREGGLPGILVQKLEEKGIQIILVPSFTRDVSILKEFSAFKELWDIFKNEKTRPDIVHLNSSKAGGIGALAARLAGIKKIIFTSHGLSWEEDRNILSRALIFFASYLTFLLCHKVIVISKSNFERVKHLWFCENKIVLIQNGIAPIDFKDGKEARREIMGIPIKDTPWIGTIAEFTRNKGLTYLVEAASLLKKHGFAFRMSLIGDGEDLPKIKKQAVKEGLYNNPNSPAYIDFPGFVPDYARNLKAFEIFILTSVKEGLPYVLLEAGQAGLAVIASNVGGIRNIIEDEITGILIHPRNAEEIESALVKYLKHPNLRAKHGEALKNKVLKEFSLERMLAETEKLYQI